MSRRIYKKELIINGRRLNKVVIDPHYEEKHADSITDEIILDLVSHLNGKKFEPTDIDEGYEYFVNDYLESEGKLYKLIWLLKDDKLYIGIVNTYRR